jgi:FMN phosphatase YigB (HAD superfamily)
MTTEKNIKAVVFDAYGTLFDNAQIEIVHTS